MTARALLTALVAALLANVTPAAAQAPDADLVVVWSRDEGASERLDAAAFRQTLKTTLSATDRPTDHRLRDAARRVDLILAMANVRSGQRVLDVGAGGGYLALLAASLVGASGEVDLHNTPGWINQFPGMDPSVLQPRLKRDNLGFIVTRWNDVPGEANSYDAIMLGQVYHDAVLEGADVLAMNQMFFRLLKPGGRVVIEDHDADERMPLAQQVGLHRISHGDVTGHLLAAGFAQGELALIESAHDDRRFNVFRPGVRGRTDRFVASFVKPLDGEPLRCPTREPC